MVTFKPFPTLETARLLLREPNLSDTQAVFRNYSDAEITKWFFNEPYDEPAQAEALILTFRKKHNDASGLTWAIATKDENNLIGTITLDKLKIGQEAELGFDLAKAYWGKGLMSEALKAVFEYSFNHLYLKQIKALTYKNNDRTVKLLTRLGFNRRGAEGEHDLYILEHPPRLDCAD
ncbi:MAG: GNAT family N-acetyltransferase [Anaerolineales bacterium]